MRATTIIIGMFLAPLLLIAQQNDGAWTNIGPSPVAVKAIAVDPHDAGTIFMGTTGGGVRKSVDGGNTWSVVNTGLTNHTVISLAIDASGPQTVYAGAVPGLFKSADGGATWQNVAAISGSVPSLAADPHLPAVVYASVGNNLGSGSIRKSIDGG